MHMYSLKRIIDVSFALIGSVVLAPLMAATALFVLAFMGSPVFFRQERPGLHQKPFFILKFRTMRNTCDENGKLLPSSERLTGFGRFLRSTSLDELPGLFNVLKGEMSLVGPRPLRVEYLDRYTPEQARRHDVKPGITGWAQVNGRNTLSWDDKFALDVWYVDNWSLMLDIKICFMTFIKVLKREGISAEGYATMHEFMGSKNE